MTVPNSFVLRPIAVALGNGVHLPTILPRVTGLHGKAMIGYCSVCQVCIALVAVYTDDGQTGRLARERKTGEKR